MKKSYFLGIAASAIATVLLSVGCNPVYNFDNLSTEVTVGADGLTLPLGGTGKITLDSLLRESGDVLTLDADGNYSFGYSDEFEYSAEVGTVAAVTDIIPTIDPQTISLFDALNADMPTFNNSQNISMPAALAAFADGFTLTAPQAALIGSVTISPETRTVTENIVLDLPEEIASVGKITFGADGGGSPVTVSINLGKLAPISNSRKIDFALELPSGVTIVSDDESHPTISKGVGSTTNNRMELNDYTLTSSSMALDFKIVSIDVSTITPAAGVLTIPFEMNYEFGMSASIQAGTITGSDPTISIATAFVFHSATLKTGTIAQDFSFSSSISQNVDVPEQIVAIDRLNIEDATSGAVPQAVVEIGITGSPVETIKIADLKIAVPSFIDIDAPSGWTLSADNVLSIASIDINTTNSTTRLLALPIKGLKNLSVTNKRISLSDDFAISGKATVDSGSNVNINSGAGSQIAITPTITLGDLKITSVVGRINFDMSEYIEPQEIDLSSVTSALGDDTQLSLNLASPEICLTVTNPVGIPINGTLTLTPYEGTTAKTPIKADIAIQPAANDGTAVVTKLLVSGDATASKEGFTLVFVDGLASIINELPTKLVATIALNVDQTTSHTLVLKESYKFNVAFDVNASLKFGAGTGSITYNKLIENVDISSLPDLGKVESASIGVKSRSTLPMDLSLDLQMQDADGAALSGITTSSTGKIEGSNDSTEKSSTTTVSLTFADGNISALKAVKKIKCVFSAATLSGGALNPEQYLDATLVLILDNGLTVDLDELLDGSDKQ